MLVRHMSSAVSVISAAAAVLCAPPAQAAPCPQVEVIFARGAHEPVGPGRVGEAFVDALRSKTDKSVGLYAVNYSADVDFVPGANDLSKRIQYVAGNCPETRLVLGGYSLGAAVTDIVLGATSPFLGFTEPLPPAMNDHIAAIALFGNGTQKVFGPVSEINPTYGFKTIDLCTEGDPLCNNLSLIHI